MIITGFDFETTGNRTEIDRITELGMVVWDTNYNTPVKTLSAFIYDESYPEMSEEVIEKTGITLEMLKRYGVPPHMAVDRLLKAIGNCMVTMAWYGSGFDFLVLKEECGRHGLPFPQDKIWVDPMLDIQFPKSIATRQLTYVAAEHGFINPFPHRALFDTMTMMHIVSKYPIKDTVTRSTWKSVLVESCTTYHERHLSKQAGFTWEEKMWTKIVPLNMLDAESRKWPFKFKIVRELPARNSQALLEKLYPPTGIPHFPEVPVLESNGETSTPSTAQV